MLWENERLSSIIRGSCLLEVKPSATRTTHLSLSVSVWTYLSVETLYMMWDFFLWSLLKWLKCTNKSGFKQYIFCCLVCLNAQLAEVDNILGAINWIAKIDDAKLWIMFWLKSVLVLYFFHECAMLIIIIIKISFSTRRLMLLNIAVYWAVQGSEFRCLYVCG